MTYNHRVVGSIPTYLTIEGAPVECVPSRQIGEQILDEILGLSVEQGCE